MKHPNHGVVALILTENPDGDCPEFDVKVEGKVMSCKIQGVPGLKWYIGCFFDQPGPTATTQCTYYTYESYLEGARMDGPLEIDRRLQSSRTRLSPGRNSNIEMFFFLPARSNGKHVTGYFDPNNWLIELKVYESDEYFDFPTTGQLSSARSIIFGRQGIIPKLNKLRDQGTERLIVHYKWQYCCVDLALELLPSPNLGGEKLPGRHSGKMIEGPPAPMLVDSTLPNYPEDGYPGPLPEYSWGPQPKDPPAWEQKGGYFANSRRVRSGGDRSPLGKRVFNAKGVSTRLRQPVALQNPRIYGEKPMLPIPPPQQFMKHLPVGWELRYTDAWKVYYVNHKDKYTTWQNPLIAEPSVPEKHQPDQGRGFWPDESGQSGSAGGASTRLQHMDEVMGFLCEKRAYAEANIQRLRMGHAYPSEWRCIDVEHWFPEYEASEPITEHIHTHTADPMLLWRAFQIRNATIIKMEALEKERSELEESMSSEFPVGSTSQCDERNRRKKRSSEELEEKDCSDVQAGHEHDGQIDYREDYGPEVPVTRDGKIDPDWHRDKIAKSCRTSGTTSSEFLEEYSKDSCSWQEDQVPVLIADSPLGDEMETDDDQLQEAMKQSLEQYDIDLKRQAYKSSTHEPRNKPPTEESSEYNLKSYNPPWRNPQKLTSEIDGPNDHNPNPIEPEYPMSRNIPEPLADGDLMDMACENEADASTLINVTKLKNISLDTRVDSWTNSDNPTLTRVFQPSEMEGYDTGNDSELYAPPPWYWLVRFGHMCQSPPVPVLVLRGDLQAANTNTKAAFSEQRVHDEPMIESSGPQNVVLAASAMGRTSVLTVPISAEALKVGPAIPTTSPSDGEPARVSDSTTPASTPMADSETGSSGSGLSGEPDPTNSGNKSKKNRRKSNRTNDPGDRESPTSIISPERHYNLRKKNHKS